MIKMKNVSKKYEKTGYKALNNVNVHIDKGEFVFVVGESGAGKSTFIKLLFKELEISSGNLLIDNVDVLNLKNKEIPFFRRKLGIVFQDFRLLPNKTVYENIAFAMEIVEHTPKDIQNEVPTVLKMVGLSNRAKYYPEQLSGGEQQRVAIARAFANNPKILICDEPTGNLDPNTSIGIMKLLESINKMGTTIIMATHDKNIVDKFQKRVITLHNGSIVQDKKGGYYHEN